MFMCILIIITSSSSSSSCNDIDINNIRSATRRSPGSS